MTGLELTGYQNIQQLFIQRYAPLLEGAFKAVGQYSVDLFFRYKSYLIRNGIISICVSLGVFLVFLYIARLLWFKKNVNKNWSDNNAGWCILFLIFSLGCIICFFKITFEISQMPQKILIPEVYIYKDLTSNNK